VTAIGLAFSELANEYRGANSDQEMYWRNTWSGPHYYKLDGKRYTKQNSEFQWVEMVHQEILNNI
jgi:hypothetical protein